MHRVVPVLALAVVALPLAATPHAVLAADPSALVKHLMPMVGTPPGPSPMGPSSVNLAYGGGPVQVTPHVYLVFWGFSNPSLDDPNGEAAYLQSFFGAIGGSGWANIQTQYYKSGPTYITNPATQFTASTDVWFDNTATDLPGVLPDALLATEAVRASQHFGYSADADYMIATPHLRNTAGFAVPTPIGLPDAGYCAWHSSTSSSAGTVAFTNLPYQTDAPLGVCGANFVNAGSAGLLDGVSIVAGHEYAEAVTDPQPSSGWIDSNGQENGDKCAWVTSGPGRVQDVTFGTRTFAVQGLWSNAATDCAITAGYIAHANGPYLADAGASVAIHATSTGGTGADHCTWSGTGATFGSASSCSTTVSFAGAGSKTISVTMTDSATPTAHSASSSASVTVASALSAAAGGPYSGAVGAAIPITATHTGGTAPVTCSWSGTGATFGNPSACATTVSYTSTGTKTALVSESDAGGGSSSASATVTVSAATLAAAPGGPYSGIVSSAIAISGGGSGGTPPYSCSWSGTGATFGSASSCATTVTYSSVGSKTITLTVTDSVSGTASASTTVSVTNSCVTDPTGDESYAPADPMGLADLDELCAVKSSTTLEFRFATVGAATEQTLAGAADPVQYRLHANSAPFVWDVLHTGAGFVVYNENTHGLSAGTATSSAAGLVVDLPLSEVGAVTTVRLESAIVSPSNPQPILQDAAPDASWLAV